MGGGKIKHLRWWIAVMLFMATVINYIDRQALSVAAPVIRDQFHMSNADYARITFAFQLAYMIMQTGSGKIFDWLGTRLGFSLCIIWWSIAGMLHALANSVTGFALFRFLLGMGEAGNWPGAAKAIAEWFPVKERSFAMGIFNTGSSTGAVIAPPLCAWIIVNFGWRVSFIVTGALGFVWLIFWLMLYRLPQEHPKLTRQEYEYIRAGQLAEAANPDSDAEPKIRWLSLFGYRQVWGLVLARFLADPVWWFYVFWLPEYLRRARNFDIQMIGLVGWIPFLTADIGCLLGGGFSSYLIKRGWSVDGARKAVMIASALMMPVAILAVHTPNTALAVALISLATFAHQSWSTNMLTLPADLFPKGIVASVSGLSGTGAAFGGMISQLAIGYVLDRFSYVPVFTAAGLLHPLAALIFVTLVGKIERVDRRI